jgi:hypothetical protein
MTTRRKRFRGKNKIEENVVSHYKRSVKDGLKAMQSMILLEGCGNSNIVYSIKDLDF